MFRPRIKANHELDINLCFYRTSEVNVVQLKGVCMRLVEYPKDGRVFRKWTYVRLGEKVEPIRAHVPGCVYLKAWQKAEDEENENVNGYGAWGRTTSAGSPYARNSKQLRAKSPETEYWKRHSAWRRRSPGLPRFRYSKQPNVENAESDDGMGHFARGRKSSASAPQARSLEQMSMQSFESEDFVPHSGWRRKSASLPRAQNSRQQALSAESEDQVGSVSMDKKEGEVEAPEEGMKYDQEEFERRFDQFDRRYALYYNKIKYQQNKRRMKKNRREMSQEMSNVWEASTRREVPTGGIAPSNRNYDEGPNLKVTNKLYHDLLEKFEDLRHKHESQIDGECDSIRLRRVATKDPSATDALHDVIDALKRALHNYRMSAEMGGSLIPRSKLRERQLRHILLEFECVAVLG